MTDVIGVRSTHMPKDLDEHALVCAMAKRLRDTAHGDALLSPGIREILYAAVEGYSALSRKERMRLDRRASLSEMLRREAMKGGAYA